LGISFIVRKDIINGFLIHWSRAISFVRFFQIYLFRQWL